jgi:glycosyltransferase involved in cell wall biosynthesis
VRRNAATRWIYGRAMAHVVTTGESLRLQLMADADLGDEHVSSVPTGIDLGLFSPGNRAIAREQLGLPMDRFIVGIVATLRSWKGHRYLVDAIAAMQGAAGQPAGTSAVSLAIVGDGPGRDNLREQVRALGLEKQVIMPGNQDNVVPWLRAMDAFALPSYANEGVPQSIMQAMACGVPVVTTPVGAIGEIVRDGETGLMVAPRDALALAAALERLRRDPALRGRLSAAGLAQAREVFSAERMVDAMERSFVSARA